MELKSCRVTVLDMDGVAHTVEVTASTLYEAVALGLKQIRGNEWVVGMPRRLNPHPLRERKTQRMRHPQTNSSAGLDLGCCAEGRAMFPPARRKN